MQDGLNRHRKKVLWLASWYPNREDRFTGDFIQRHAKAASHFNDIYIIHIRESNNISKPYEVEVNVNGHLTEHIVFFKPSKGLLSIFSKHVTWFTLYKKAFQEFIEKNGKPQLIHVHVAWKAGLMALWLKHNLNLSYIITEHWGMYNRVVKDNFFKKPFIVRYLIKKVFSQSQQLVSVSQYLANCIQHWMPRQKTVIIPNVVDTDLFYLQSSKEKKFTFIHVSNGVALKNIKGILNAFYNCSCHPDFDKMQLQIIGIDKNKYIEYIKDLGIAHKVIIHGVMDYIDVASAMRNAHCLILNSLMENSPCVIGEAHCCGMPVIATCVGGVPELVNENNGILIPTEDDDALSKAILNIFQNFQNFEPAGIANEANKKFGYDSVGRQFDVIYKTL